MEEIEYVAKKDPETFEMFITWLGGTKNYEEMF